jgi:hypothetical protein
MSTPTSTVAVPSAPNSRWRAAILWLAFAATLLTGLVLAARFGGSVPTLIDGVVK